MDPDLVRVIQVIHTCLILTFLQYYSIENAIGNIVEMPDGSLVRELHLDSTDNQDQCALLSLS